MRCPLCEKRYPCGEQHVCQPADLERVAAQIQQKRKCVICGEALVAGEKHVCRPEALRRFEAKLRRRDRDVEGAGPPAPGFEEQLADGFAMLGDQ